MPFSLSSFRKQLRYETSASAGQIQAHLKQIAELDKLAEKKKKQYTIAAITAVILAFVCLFSSTAVPFFMFVMVAFIVLAVVVCILGSRWGRFDLFDMRYELPQRLVEMLSRDMAKNSPLDARLDFSSPTTPPKQTSQGPYPRRSGWKQAFYEDPWLHLQGQFLDSTTFDLNLIEHTVVRSGTKRSSSGKVKHKRKVKGKGCEIQLVLRFPRKKYGAISLLQADLPQAVSLPAGIVLKQIKANDHQLMLRVKAPIEACHSVDSFYRLVTKMFLSAYQALNLSKTLSKSSV